MIGGGVSDEVIQYIEQWIPQDHEDEYGVQKGLQTYLDKSINESGNANTHPAFGGGTGQQYPVRREYGKSNADVAVGDDIGIDTVVRDSLPPWSQKLSSSQPDTARYVTRSRK